MMMTNKMTAASSNLHEYSVSEISGALKNVIEDNFSLVRVRGELGRVVRAGSGHMYMDLKDERAVMNGVIWKGNAARLKIEPEQGMEVVATGRLTTYAGQSRYQIIIDSLEPAGAGALMALFEKRKKLLAAEGLFDEERKQELPFLPGVIGVVTSPSGAVIRDILHRLRERFPSRVLVWPTLVQGKEAEKQIVAAIQGFNKLPLDGPVPRPDVLIVARGGGSLEDLWCFNEEALARAAAASDIPLISAVGHETDTTLIDYVSDRRAPTPTAAAEIATPVRSELQSELLNKERRLLDAQARMLDAMRSDLRAAERGLGRPEDILGVNEQRLDRASERLAGALRGRVENGQSAYAHVSGRFAPAILSNGFSVRDGEMLRVSQKLQSAIARVVERRQDRLINISTGEHLLKNQLAQNAQSLEHVHSRFTQLVKRGVDRETNRLESLAKLLSSLSHRNVLARGFALVRDDTGKLMRSSKSASIGDAGSIEFGDGKRGITFGDKGQFSEEKPPPKKTRKRIVPEPTSKSQKSLFD